MSEFSVYDDSGAVWPPGFVSQLADPASPHTMVKRQGATAEQATANRHRCAELGIGLGNGTIPGLKKRTKVESESSRVIPYRFVLSVNGGKSMAHEVWDELRAAEPGTRRTSTEIGLRYSIAPSRVRSMFRPAVSAGVFEMTRRGDEAHYGIGPKKPGNRGI